MPILHNYLSRLSKRNWLLNFLKLTYAGLKSDLRRNSRHLAVSEKEGEIMQLHVNAAAFYEFSVGQEKKLNTIFSKVVRLGMRKKMNAYKNSCSVQ